MSIQNFLPIVSLQSHDSDTQHFSADLCTISDMTTNLYRVNLYNNQFLIDGTNISTPESVLVETNQITSNLIDIKCTFSPSNLNTIDSTYYGLIVQVNGAENVRTKHREYSTVFQVRNFII